MVGTPEAPAGDPRQVWGVYRSVFGKLLAIPPGQKAMMMETLAKMVQAFPQTLVATAAWPDTKEMGPRREAVCLALLRRTLHCQAAGAATASCSSLQTLVLTLLHESALVRWRRALTDLVHLWHRLAVAAERLAEGEGAEVDGVTVAEGGVAVRLVSATQEEDEDFPSDGNYLVLACPDVVEELQTCLTSVLEQALPTLVSHLPSLLPRVHAVLVLQLEGAEAGLKASTLHLLASLHRAAGPGLLLTWGEEASWLAEVLRYLAGPLLATTADRQALAEGVAELCGVLVARWQGGVEEWEVGVFVVHLLPAWLDLVRRRLTGRLGAAEDALEEVMAVAVVEGVTEEEEEAMLEALLGSDRQSLSLVAAELAWREVARSGGLGEGEGGGKRRLEEEVGGRSLVTCSAAWARLLGQFEGRLDSQAALANFTSVLRAMLTRLAGRGRCGRVQVADRSLLQQATASLAALLPTATASLPSLLDSLDTLAMCGALWPGAGQPGSLIQPLQQVRRWFKNSPFVWIINLARESTFGLKLLA